MNDYKFWNEYLVKLKKEIKKLCAKKEKLYIDLHIHSNYSSDGKQSIKEILNTTKNKGFDVIAITDHDSLNCYDELYDFVKDGFTNPLVIPGIEFTIDNKNYGSQCHILQLFVNPKDKDILNNVDQNYKAMFNRSKIQFKRIKENQSLQEIFINNNINVSYDEYLNYLNLNNLLPEYDTLCSYLMTKFKSKEVTNFDIFELLQKYNKKDCFNDRREFKEKRYNKLKEKYSLNDDNMYNTRFLLSMLAVREVDDDWWEKPSCGSLSVNSYGQLTIDELNKKFPTYFAHPTENKLSVVEDIIKEKKSIVDSHDATLKYYENMNFYIISSNEFLKILY